MKSSQKYSEPFLKVVLRTLVTSAVIALILTFARVFPYQGMGKTAVFGLIWLMLFCVVFGGHWLEVLFINYLKDMLPQNILLLYFARIAYWILCSVPLFILANFAANSLTSHGMHLGNWESFGLVYIGIELIMHTFMYFRWKKSFYNGVY